MKKVMVAIAVTLTLIIAVSFATKSTSALNRATMVELTNYANPNIGGSIPPGAWSLICSPSMKRGEVVDAYAVTSEKGNTVTKVFLRNRSKNAVIAVKLGWSLFYNDAPGKVLANGESPLLGVPLMSKVNREVEFPLVSFSKVSKPFLKDGQISGDFRIVVTVTDVLFADNEDKVSKLSWLNSSLASFLPTASAHSSSLAVVKVVSYSPTMTFEGCQNQECKFASDCYSCAALNGTGCSTSGCTSCTENACGAELEN